MEREGNKQWDFPHTFGTTDPLSREKIWARGALGACPAVAATAAVGLPREWGWKRMDKTTTKNVDFFHSR